MENLKSWPCLICGALLHQLPPEAQEDPSVKSYECENHHLWVLENGVLYQY